MTLEPTQTIASPPSKKRTTFLTLSRELRQAIILDSYELIPAPTNSCLHFLWFPEEGPCAHIYTINKGAKVLKAIDAGLIDDVEFVKKAWKKAHDEEQVKPMRESREKFMRAWGNDRK